MQNRKVAAIAVIGEADAPHVERAVAEMRAQRGVAVDLVLVDTTGRGELEGRAFGEGVTVIAQDSPSRGEALRRGTAATDALVVLLLEPRARHDAEHALRLARAFAADDRVRAVTGDLRVDREGHAEYVASDLAGHAPTSCWSAGAAFHRELLAEIDTRAFFPSEAALLEAARRAGTARHLARATATVDAVDFDAGVEAARVDAELLRLAALPSLAQPEVTVLLATHERREILVDCLAGFARQLVRPGTLEIVVCDDASTDGTPELLDSLELAVPLRHVRCEEPSGAATARNLGLPLATGRLVLFVNDDTIPAPDLVRRHLEAHRDLGADAMVLGSFRQPDAILANALNRVLDASHLVFGYAGFEPGQELPGEHFYTCNASVALDAVRAICAFEPGYALCGGEDTDIGLRLVAHGRRLFYRPECRAEHRHRLAFDDFRRRQRVVARAHVRLYRDHPELLEGLPFADRTAADLRANLRDAAPLVPLCESAARALGDLDLASVERAGAAANALAQQLAAALDQCVRRLHNVYWTEGLVDGFAQLGHDGFRDLVAANSAPLTEAN